MIDRADLFKRLAEGSHEGLPGLAASYVRNFQDVIQLAGDPLLRRNVLKSSAFGNTLVDQAKASVILNDTSFLQLRGGKSMSILMLSEEGVKKACGTNQIAVRVTEDQFKILSEKGAALTFRSRIDDQDQAVVEHLVPLIEAGLLVVEPERALMYHASTEPSGQRMFQLLSVAEMGSAQQWEVVSPEMNNIPAGDLLDATGAPQNKNQSNVAEVVLPYLAGTSSSDFVKIIRDEGDLLKEFRSSIRELVESVRKDGRDTQAILHDVVSPRIARLQRRFDQISRMSSLKIGGAVVGSVTLALTTAFTGGLVAGVAALAGGTGLLMVTKEIAGRQADLAALRDDPVYLLWKMMQGSGLR